MSQRIILPGGSGFLGRLLSRLFAARDWEVVVLSRRPLLVTPPVRAVAWDGRTRDEWVRELDGAAVVVNLAGRSVDCRYHARNRKRMLDSRLESTRSLGEAMCECAQPPAVWMNSSTATIYRHSVDRPMDETDADFTPTPAAKDAFSIEVATRWEAAFNQAPVTRTRRIALRTGMVMADEPGTVYRVLRRLVRLGLGGPMGGGRQFVSWIHGDDFCRAVEWLIGREDISGPVNLTAPLPVPNAEMMRTLRAAFGVPWGLPASRWMLEVGAFLLRTETELVLKSRRVVPRRLLDAGFEFQFSRFEDAVDDLRGTAVPERDDTR